MNQHNSTQTAATTTAAGLRGATEMRSANAAVVHTRHDRLKAPVEATVFIVDPDAQVRESVRRLVHLMNFRCDAYESGHEFLRNFDATRPGCVLLEVRIPDLNGLELQTQLRARGAQTPIVFLASHATVSIAVLAMRSGALNFLEKPVREHELWETIQQAFALEQSRLAAAHAEARLREQLAQLTSNERRLLELISQGKGKNSIADELGVCLRTIQTRRKAIMHKLRLESYTELIRLAMAAANGHDGPSGPIHL